MGSDKLSGRLSGSHIAQSSKTTTGEIMNADAVAKIGVIGVDRKLSGWFADVDTFAINVQSAGAVEIVPLVQIGALIVEYLHAVALSIRDVHFSSAISADTVH
jgi:hypothetical protein